MKFYKEIFTGFENNKSITLYFSGDGRFPYSRDYVSYLSSVVYENYINFAYYVRYCECIKQGITNNIPFKPLFIKENSNGKLYYTDNINEVSFLDYYGKLINNTIMYSADRLPVLFPLLSSEKELGQKAYDYFCKLFPAPKSERIPPKNFVLIS